MVEFGFGKIKGRTTLAFKVEALKQVKRTLNSSHRYKSVGPADIISILVIGRRVDAQNVYHACLIQTYTPNT